MRSLLMICALSSTALAEELKLPPLEVEAKIELPAMPSFDRAESAVLTVGELRAAKPGQHRVKGYITWYYDCVRDIAARGEARTTTLKRIEDTPSLCSEPRFMLGATPNEQPSRGVWVIDVPNPPTKRERKTLPMESLRDWPKVPALSVGAFVTVGGTWKDGKLVYGSLEPAKPMTTRANAKVARPIVGKPTLFAKLPACMNAKCRESIKITNDAVDRVTFQHTLQQAIALWDQNHAAHYYLGQLLSGIPGQWGTVRGHFASAVSLAPGQAMYHLALGQALYEAAIEDARKAHALAQQKKPEEVVVDLASLKHDAALAQLESAIEIEPRLWRAHDYIGRIYRDRGEARWAAESFDAAIRAGATGPHPWAAYVHLLQQWRHVDMAIAIARKGLAIAPSPELHFALGVALDEKKSDEALGVFTQVLDASPHHQQALWHRANIYLRKRQKPEARYDLQRLLRQPLDELTRDLVGRMLVELR